MIQRFAAGLSGTRSQRLQLARCAQALRVSLRSVPPGRMAFRLGGPGAVLARLADRLPSGVMVEEAEPGLHWFEGGAEECDACGRTREEGEHFADDGEWYVARQELVPAHGDEHPLRFIPLDPDPKTDLVGVFAGVGTDEVVEVAIDLMPVPHHRVDEWARELPENLPPLAVPAAASGTRRSLGSVLADINNPMGAVSASARSPAPRPSPRARPSKDQAAKAVGPLFHVQFLVRAAAPTKGRAVELVHRATKPLLDLLGAPGPDAGNWLRARGIDLRVAFLGANAPWNRRRFDARFETGIFPGWRRASRVSWRDIAGLLVPPTVKCPLPMVKRAPAASPPPAGLRVWRQPSREVLYLGKVAGKEPYAGMGARETFDLGVFGRKRSGKSTWAECAFLAEMLAGGGGSFIDPHRDAIEVLKAYLWPRVDDVVVVDFGQPWDTMRLPGLNYMDVAGLSLEETARRRIAFMGGIEASAGWKDSGAPRALAIVRAATKFLQALSRVLPAMSPAPTIFQIPTVLNNEAWRDEVLADRRMPASVRSWWRNEWSDVPKGAASPVNLLISKLRDYFPGAALLGGRHTLNFRRIMDRRGILLFAAIRTGDSQVDRSLPSIFVRGILQAGYSRHEIQEADRGRLCPVHRFAGDELPTWDGEDIPDIIREMGKYRLPSMLLSQSPEDLRPETARVIVENASAIITSGVDGKGGKMIAEHMRDVTVETIQALPRYTYLASVTLDGHRTHGFTVKGVQPADLFEAKPGVVDAAIAADPQYRLAAQVVDELEDLDERLLAALKEGPSDFTPRTRGAGGRVRFE